MRSIRSYIYNFGGRFLPQLIFLATNVILARFLSPRDFGAVGVLGIFMGIANTLTDAGFGGSLIKEKNIDKQDCRTVATYNVGIGLLCYVILSFLSGYLEEFFKYEALRWIIRVLCLVFIFDSLMLVPRSLMIKRLEFGKLSVISVASTALGAVAGVIGGILGWGSFALVAYYLVFSITQSVSVIAVNRYTLSLGFSKSSFKRLFSFGFFTTVCNIVDSMYENVMTFLFGKFMNLSMAGYFSQAKKLETSASNSLVQTANTVSFPVLTKLKEDRAEFEREAESIFRNIVSLIFPGLAVICVYSKEIILLVYGKAWEASSPYLSLLIYVGMLFMMESMVRNNIKSLGVVKSLALITMLKRIVGVGLIMSFLLISPFAMLYGYILSTAIGWLTNLFLYCRLIGKGFVKMALSQIVIALPCVVTLCVMYLLKYGIGNLWINIIANIGILVVYYLFVLPKTGGISIFQLIKGRR